MILVLLVFLGGVLTILSPCILPVLPFVFARSQQKFLTSGLPMLAGMAVTFAGIATLAAVGGAWAVRVNQYGRIIAMVMLAAFAATLLSRRLADWMSRPFIALGNRLISPGANGEPKSGVLPSLLLGVATGFLWAPCAGPILGLVLTGAALSGPSAHTTALLFAYAAGAASSLAVAILAGGRVFAALKRFLGTGEWIRRALGVGVLLALAAIATGADSGVLTRVSLAGTTRLERSLIEAIHPVDGLPVSAKRDLAVEGQLPSLSGAVSWMNSPALTPEGLRGKVVLVDFWTYSCINCLRTLPFVKAWYEKYKDHGLVVIGVHAPEFAFEKDPANVARAIRELGITYPVALDNDYAIWRGFNNQYWPAHYFIDATGAIRSHHFGEGNYQESEQTIRQLLIEAGYTNLPPAGMTVAKGTGAEAPADEAHVLSPETYIGYRRAQSFASPEPVVRDHLQVYSAPNDMGINQWALAGPWTIEGQKAVLEKAPGKIVYRFFARDLHLVLGPGTGAAPVRFRVQLDGAAPGANHGADTDANGEGIIREERLYQLIRQSTNVGEHVFSIEFLGGDAQAYAFTFG
jgi:cytochrome c biogenesis protein CcdA/thiol-disulfide isomerase/thioredoxin